MHTFKILFARSSTACENTDDADTDAAATKCDDDARGELCVKRFLIELSPDADADGSGAGGTSAGCGHVDNCAARDGIAVNDRGGASPAFGGRCGGRRLLCWGLRLLRCRPAAP